MAEPLQCQRVDLKNTFHGLEAGKPSHNCTFTNDVPNLTAES